MSLNFYFNYLEFSFCPLHVSIRTKYKYIVLIVSKIENILVANSMKENLNNLEIDKLFLILSHNARIFNSFYISGGGGG